MAFVYDHEKYRAIDSEIGAEVFEGGHNLDSTEIFPYTFVRDGLRIEFAAVPRQRRVQFINEKTGKKSIQSVDCVFFIPEEHLERAVLSHSTAKKNQKVAKEQYEELKRQICEGLFALETQRGAGNLLHLVPDFSVCVVSSKSIPSKDTVLSSKPVTKRS